MFDSAFSITFFDRIQEWKIPIRLKLRPTEFKAESLEETNKLNVVIHCLHRGWWFELQAQKSVKTLFRPDLKPITASRKQTTATVLCNQPSCIKLLKSYIDAPTKVWLVLHRRQCNQCRNIELCLGAATLLHANDQSDLLQYIARATLEEKNDYHLCFLFEGMCHNVFAIWILSFEFGWSRNLYSKDPDIEILLLVFSVQRVL